MTLDEVRTQAREYARVSTSGMSDARLNQMIQNAVTRFARDVGGFAATDYPTVVASFDTRTTMAIRVTITGGTNALSATDVAITGTNRTEASGSTVASDFQTTLRAAIGGGANATVTYDDFAFTVDTVDGTSITFAEPSDVNYSDARDMLGLTGTTTETNADVTGGFPENCTVKSALQSNALTVDYVAWEDLELLQLPREFAFNPKSFGIPNYYHIRGRDLYLMPSPSRQGLIKVWYRSVPDDIVFAGYQECGLSDLGGNEATGLSASTQYYYKISIDDSAVTEYDITTATDVTFDGVIALMNAQNTGATFALVGGDLRCTSDTQTGVSSIALSAGTTGTDLFATLTGFSAFDTAVDGDTTLPTDIPAQYHEGIVFLTSYFLARSQWDQESLAMSYRDYNGIKNAFLIDRHSQSTQPDMNIGAALSWGFTVTDNES